MNADGSNQTLYVDGSTSATGSSLVHHVAWSPDGTKLAYSQDVQIGNDEIFVVPAAAPGGAATMLTNTLGRDEGVYWAQAATFTLEAHKAGSGGGTITANPVISCAADECSGDFADPTEVTLTATPGANSTFAGWSGDCTGTGACTVRMSGPREVTATFDTVPPTPPPPPPPPSGGGGGEEAVAGSGPTCTSSSPRAPRLRHPSVPNSISS
jgi:hypothetical protein